MPLHLRWSEIALRLGLSFLAGMFIGLNRTEHGRPAGLRTTILVCLAACIAMLQANLLLNVAGKASDSFVVLDLMRLPLGILSGMGFIGGGAILRKGEFVLGVTTAATLWFVTVVGLCFGGGQLALGTIGTLLGIFVLLVLKWLERRMPQDRRGLLTFSTNDDKPTEEQIRIRLIAADCKILSFAQSYADHARLRTARVEVLWRANYSKTNNPGFIDELAHHPNIVNLEWNPQVLNS
jgi:putative Mg2+ transporter-C (MgtC) family protein